MLRANAQLTGSYGSQQQSLMYSI